MHSGLGLQLSIDWGRLTSDAIHVIPSVERLASCDDRLIIVARKMSGIVKTVV